MAEVHDCGSGSPAVQDVSGPLRHDLVARIGDEFHTDVGSAVRSPEARRPHESGAANPLVLEAPSSPVFAAQNAVRQAQRSNRFASIATTVAEPHPHVAANMRRGSSQHPPSGRRLQEWNRRRASQLSVSMHTEGIGSNLGRVLGDMAVTTGTLALRDSSSVRVDGANALSPAVPHAPPVRSRVFYEQSTGVFISSALHEKIEKRRSKQRVRSMGASDKPPQKRYRSSAHRTGSKEPVVSWAPGAGTASPIANASSHPAEEASEPLEAPINSLEPGPHSSCAEPEHPSAGRSWLSGDEDARYYRAYLRQMLRGMRDVNTLLLAAAFGISLLPIIMVYIHLNGRAYLPLGIEAVDVGTAPVTAPHAAWTGRRDVNSNSSSDSSSSSAPSRSSESITQQIAMSSDAVLVLFYTLVVRFHGEMFVFISMMLIVTALAPVAVELAEQHWARASQGRYANREGIHREVADATALSSSARPVVHSKELATTLGGHYSTYRHAPRELVKMQRGGGDGHDPSLIGNSFDEGRTHRGIASSGVGSPRSGPSNGEPTGGTPSRAAFSVGAVEGVLQSPLPYNGKKAKRNQGFAGNLARAEQHFARSLAGVSLTPLRLLLQVRLWCAVVCFVFSVVEQSLIGDRTSAAWQQLFAFTLERDSGLRSTALPAAGHWAPSTEAVQRDLALLHVVLVVRFTVLLIATVLHAMYP